MTPILSSAASVSSDFARPSRAAHATAADQELILRTMSASTAPMDAYRLSRLTGLSAMECGRTLTALHESGKVANEDPLGTANDLACRYKAVPQG